MSKTMNLAKMIARRVSKGYNPNESKTLLADLIKNHYGDNLVAALKYNEFTK